MLITFEDRITSDDEAVFFLFVIIVKNISSTNISFYFIKTKNYVYFFNTITNMAQHKTPIEKCSKNLCHQLTLVV